MTFIKRILMNKNIEVLAAEYDSATGVFNDIYDIWCNISYSSYILNDLYDSKTSFGTNLSEWFKVRVIPSWRDKLDLLLHKYQYITGYSDIRINRLCILLNRQIEKLKEIIKNG